MADTIVKSKKIPLADGIPLLGSIFPMLKDPLGFFVEQYQKKGPIYRVKIPQKNMIIISGPKANRFMQREGLTYLSNGDAWQPFKKHMNADKFILSSDGEEHFTMRRIMNRGYSTEMIKGRMPEVINNIENILKQQEVQKDIPLTDFTRKVVTGQLSNLLTNHQTEEYFEDIIRFTHYMINITSTRWPTFFLNAPQFKKSKKRIYELARIVLEKHKNNPNANDKPDFIDDVLAANKGEEKFFTENDLLSLALSPFLAGIDTVANTTAFLIYDMLKNPEIMQKAIQEVDAIFDEGIPDFNTLRKAKVLHAVILETLRIHPVAFAQIRNAKKAFEFEGYQIEKGETVFVVMTIPHFLPELFPNPYKYDIDRYAPPRNEHRQPAMYAPFGLGPHTCAGNKLAEVLLMTTLAALLRYVEFEPLPKNHVTKVVTAPLPGPTPDSTFRIKKFRDVKY